MLNDIYISKAGASIDCIPETLLAVTYINAFAEKISSSAMIRLLINDKVINISGYKFFIK